MISSIGPNRTSRLSSFLFKSQFFARKSTFDVFFKHNNVENVEEIEKRCIYIRENIAKRFGYSCPDTFLQIHTTHFNVKRCKNHRLQSFPTITIYWHSNELQWIAFNNATDLVDSGVNS